MRNFIIVVATLLPLTAFGHARLLLTGTTPPRNASTGLKSGPCGNIARTGNNVEFTKGSTITVQWEEVVNHPGRYEFYFSPANDQNFVLLKTVPDTQDGGLAAGQTHQYNTQITFPDVTCVNCTLQLIQVMTEDPANPSLYYSCSDIALVNGAPTPTPTPVATPTPTGTPDPVTCH